MAIVNFKLKEQKGEVKSPIRELAKCLTVKNDVNVEVLLGEFLLRTYRCSLNEEPNPTMLVLSGKQGIGKSTFANRLTPDKLQQYAHNGTWPGEGDFEILLCQSYIIHLDGLFLVRPDLRLIKNLIRQKQYFFRRPYEEGPRLHLRKASVVLTTNQPENVYKEFDFVRFLDVKSIDLAALEKINIDSLWAEVAFHYKKNSGQH